MGAGRSRCWELGVCLIKCLLKRTGTYERAMINVAALPMVVKVQCPSWLLNGAQGILSVCP